VSAGEHRFGKVGVLRTAREAERGGRQHRDDRTESKSVLQDVSHDVPLSTVAARPQPLPRLQVNYLSAGPSVVGGVAGSRYFALKYASTKTRSASERPRL